MKNHLIINDFFGIICTNVLLYVGMFFCDEKEEFNGSPDDIPNAPLNSARL